MPLWCFLGLHVLALVLLIDSVDLTPPPPKKPPLPPRVWKVRTIFRPVARRNRVRVVGGGWGWQEWSGSGSNLELVEKKRQRVRAPRGTRLERHHSRRKSKRAAPGGGGHSYQQTFVSESAHV